MDDLFITLDPILDANIMEMADWCASVPKSPEDAPVDVSIRWKHHVSEMKLDSANLFFVLMIDQDQEGKLKLPLDGTGVTREAFGRIPGEKSPIDYLCEFLIPNEGNEKLKILLEALANRFDGHACLAGTGGIIIRGALSMQETKELRERLISRNWRINQNETIDGAVSEIIRLLLLLLRKAESRVCGVMLREHR
tara:strand:- start:2531 stop:3115 length:585 start_codon:yes stop_codon:yes gene_type:complete